MTGRLTTQRKEPRMYGRDAVIVGCVRTPLGRRRGRLAQVHAVDAAALVLNALVDRVGIDPGIVDDVIWGCVSQVGEQASNIGRYAVLAAGWPDSVPATTVDRQCGSSQQSVHFAAAGVACGQYEFAVAGGVEMMSRVPMGSAYLTAPGSPVSAAVAERYGVSKFSQGLSAEMIASRWNLSRARLDEYSLASHARAAAASDGGLFEAEIAPVRLPDGTVLDADEGIRRDSTPERMASLGSAFTESGVVTAGNSSQISDGAAAVLITTPDCARRHGLKPLARIHSAVLAGDDPVMMLTAPIPATRKVLKSAGLTIDEIDTFEVNEAFAPVPLAWMAETGANFERVNPNGGAIALGHPLGASGARLMTTMVHRMRRDGLRYGLQTMCEAGGQANAIIVEAL
jgi:acetyl-CoA acyltransferase